MNGQAKYGLVRDRLQDKYPDAEIDLEPEELDEQQILQI